MSAEWNYDLGSATFTYLGAHRTKSKENTATDPGSFGASASAGTNETSQTSHELRLSSNGGGAWKWGGGLYFFEETQDVYTMFGSGVLVSYIPDFKSKSQAAFGQVTYAVSDALRNAPKATLSLGYEHMIPLDAGNVVLRADTRFSSQYYNDDTNSALFRQAGYRKSDVSARYNSPDYKWSLTAYVRNLENRNVMASRYPAVVGSSFGYMAAPCTMGVSASTSF